MNQIYQLTVGMPVFNGELTIADALKSVLSQTYSNIRVVISDDASTDNTEAICKEIASKDNRVIYVRQMRNIGLYANFQYVLQQADTKYFTWASQDDLRSSNFLEENLRFLEQNIEYVGSTSPNRFTTQTENDLINFSLEGSFDSRVRKFFDNILSSHAILYSVFRTSLLKSCPYLHESYLALDWSICMYMISLGPIKRTPNALIEIGSKGVSNSRNRWNKFRSLKIEYLIPFYRYSFVAVSFFSRMHIYTILYTAYRLLGLNLWALKHQILETIVDYKNEKLLRQ
jgi:glycosyltransferase involved in cell wall biosynthesis